MFECVDCRHKGKIFKGRVLGTERGSLTYKVICPKCGSEKINVLPGVHEKDIMIGTKLSVLDMIASIGPLNLGILTALITTYRLYYGKAKHLDTATKFN